MFIHFVLTSPFQIHSFVGSALLTTANPSYSVYFRRRNDAATEDEEFSLIVGVRAERVMGLNKKMQVRVY